MTYGTPVPYKTRPCCRDRSENRILVNIADSRARTEMMTPLKSIIDLSLIFVRKRRQVIGANGGSTIVVW